MFITLQSIFLNRKCLVWLANQDERPFPCHLILLKGTVAIHRKEFNHFLGIALGSIAELETQLLLSERLKYIEEAQLANILKATDETAKMLKGLQKSLKSTND